MLSCLSVRVRPERCLRLWCSLQYQRISLLHCKFPFPLPPSSLTHLVPDAEVRPRHFKYDAINHLHDSLRPVNPDNACTPRITATAGTWFVGAYSSRLDVGTKEVYNPKAFIPHAVSLGQAFAHCRIFPVAADRSRMARISVPLWGVVLSHPLPVVALVSHYLTNKLMGTRPLPYRAVKPFNLAITCDITPSFDELCHSKGYVPCSSSPVRHWSPCGDPFDLHA